jgi:transcription termination/antitermination protein NusG
MADYRHRPIPFRKGETVRLRRGSFTGMVGVLEEVLAEPQRLIVVVSVFGRQVPVEANFTDVERGSG